MLYRVLKDGTKYLKPSKRWHFDIRNANGAVRRVNEPGGTRTLDQRINLPHGLSPAILLRSGLYHLPRRKGRSGAARQVSEDPGRGRARSFLLIAQSGGLSRLAPIGRTVPTALRGFQHMERFYRERFGPGTPIEVRCSTN